MGDIVDQVMAVIRHAGMQAPVRLIGTCVDQFVLALRRAELMKIDCLVFVGLRQGRAFPGLWITAVIKAAAVLGPGSTAELDPLNEIAGVLAGGDVPDAELLPVTARFRHAIDEPFPIFARRGLRQRGGAVFRECVWIKQHACFGFERFRHMEHTLILQTRVAVEEPLSTMLKRHAGALIVPGLLQSLADFGALRNGLEITKSHFVLGLHPGLCFITVVIFQPAIGIRHLGAVIIVDDAAVFPGFRVGEALGGGDGGHEAK